MSYGRQGRSPVYLWSVAVLAGWGAREFWSIGQQDEAAGEACVAAALLTLICARLSWNGLVNHDEKQLMKRIHRRSEEESDVHGSSQWATHKEVRAAGMLKPGGIFLGEHQGKELFYKGENSMTVLAPPGAGKTTCFASQFLARTDHDVVIVNDPKLELWLTHASDLKRRYRVLTVSPWFQAFEDQFDGKIAAHDDGFDPCSFLDPKSPYIIDDCRLLATLLIPRHQKSSATSEFFDDFSRSILVAYLLLILSERGSVTLPELRARIMAPNDKVIEDISQMMVSTAFSGALAEEGARLASPKMNSDREWSSGISGAMRALKPYDKHGPLGRSVEKAGVDFASICDRKTVVFFAQPPEKIESHEGYASMTLVLAMEQLARVRRKKRCVFLLDELQNTPSALIPVLKGISLYRGSGLQFLCIFQFLASLKRHIGESWREFLSVDAFVTFGAPTDPETLEVLSRLAGQTTVYGTSYSSQAEQLAAGGVGVAMSRQEVARELLTAAEARTMDDNTALIFTSNLAPIQATKQSVLKSKLRKRLDPNPY